MGKLMSVIEFMIVKIFSALILLRVSSSRNLTYSVSGLSSGAFFTVQYSVAHSSEVVGSGIVAGGPYYCTQDDFNNVGGLCTSHGNRIDINTLINYTNQFANENYIDPISNIKHQNILVFSGTLDTIVEPSVVTKTYQYYQALNANVYFKNTIPCEHSMLTNFYGSNCSYLGEPYINNCNYNLAGVILQYIYNSTNNSFNPPLNNSDVPYNNLIKINQTNFIPKNRESSKSISMNSFAYAYVATQCQIAPLSDNCKLHVVFHGCGQAVNSYSDLAKLVKYNDTYARYTGYNGWAETNNFVVLYPQADINNQIGNPFACWDFWGYNGGNYAWKSGDQIQTCHNMIDWILYGE